MTDQASSLGESPRVAGETDGSASAVRVVVRDENQFAVVDADGRTTLPALLDAVSGVQRDDVDGVVVRAPGEDANAIQRLVDGVEDAPDESLEMVETEVIETEAGYQYHSYLMAGGDR